MGLKECKGKLKRRRALGAVCSLGSCCVYPGLEWKLQYRQMRPLHCSGPVGLPGVSGGNFSVPVWVVIPDCFLEEDDEVLGPLGCL